MEVFNLPLPSNDGIRSNTSRYDTLEGAVHKILTNAVVCHLITQFETLMLFKLEFTFLLNDFINLPIPSSHSKPWDLLSVQQK
jgi:hypothetical protein